MGSKLKFSVIVTVLHYSYHAYLYVGSRILRAAEPQDIAQGQTHTNRCYHEN